MCHGLFVFFHSSHGFCYFNHHGTFYSLTEDVTAKIVDSIDGAGCVQCVGRATTTAVKFRPAVLTFWLRVATALFKLTLHLLFCNPIPNVSHTVFVIPDELVAREELAPWCDSEIFGS